MCLFLSLFTVISLTVSPCQFQQIDYKYKVACWRWSKWCIYNFFFDFSLVGLKSQTKFDRLRGRERRLVFFSGSLFESPDVRPPLRDESKVPSRGLWCSRPLQLPLVLELLLSDACCMAVAWGKWLCELRMLLLLTSTTSGGSMALEPFTCPLGFVEICGDGEVLSGVSWRLLRLLYLLMS